MDFADRFNTPGAGRVSGEGGGTAPAAVVRMRVKEINYTGNTSLVRARIIAGPDGGPAEAAADHAVRVSGTKAVNDILMATKPAGGSGLTVGSGAAARPVAWAEVAGGGGTLSTGQYQGQCYSMIADNAAGWAFPFLSAIPL